MRLLLLVPFLTLSLWGGALWGATVDGAKIHWSSEGKGPKTVILVHGWTCDETTWDAQAPALAAKYRVITLDLPGHGQSGAPKDGKFSMDLFAKAVEAVRRGAKADHVVLVGHSMGTPVIVQYQRLFPGHAVALVFVDGMVRNPGPALLQASRQLKGPVGIKTREDMIRGMFSESTTPAMQSHIMRMMMNTPEATAVGAMAATGDPSIWKDDVITLPVLGIYADHSKMGDRAYMKRRFPALEYVEIPNTGHFLMIEKPEEFNRLLLSFLSKVSFSAPE